METFEQQASLMRTHLNNMLQGAPNMIKHLEIHYSNISKDSHFPPGTASCDTARQPHGSHSYLGAVQKNMHYQGGTTSTASDTVPPGVTVQNTERLVQEKQQVLWRANNFVLHDLPESKSGEEDLAAVYHQTLVDTLRPIIEPLTLAWLESYLDWRTIRVKVDSA